MELIRRGARGEDVRDVQHRLLGAGARIEPNELEGTFGPSTEEAVREFQRTRGLPADGIMGPDTWGQLVEAGYRLSDRTLYLRSPAFRGDDVRGLQRMLGALGFDAGKEDGIFGPRTDRAVREFQRNVASRVDGIVGLDTVHAIGRYRPPVDAPSRAVVRESEAARGPGLALSGSVIAIDPDRTDVDRTDRSLAIALELSEALVRLGARPLLLRSGPHAGPTDDRIRRANAAGAAALISIAVGSGEQAERGSACFHYGTPTTHSPMGRRLAESIRREVVEGLGLPDGGVHPRSIAILRETRMPAVRIEPAVADDPDDAARIADPSFPRDVARAIADGVVAFSRPAPADLARST
ncbi:MAG: peptidoglycan-binding protein [Actinomycetota bacterium]